MPFLSIYKVLFRAEKNSAHSFVILHPFLHDNNFPSSTGSLQWDQLSNFKFFNYNTHNRLTYTTLEKH